MRSMNKTVLIIGALVIAVSSFILGYRLATKPDETSKVVNDKTKEVIRIVERPGEKVTEIIREAEHRESKKSVINKTPKNTVNGLIASPLSRYEKPIYGIQYTREFIGPISVGAFYLSNETIGVSVGISF